MKVVKLQQEDTSDRGTQTVSIFEVDYNRIMIHDTYNNFKCEFPIEQLSTVLKRFTEMSKLKLTEELSRAYIRESWFDGNYYYTNRMKLYIEYLGLCYCNDKPKFNPNSLRRMSTKNLLSLYNKLQVYGTIQKQRKEGTNG